MRGSGRFYKRGSVWWIAYYHRGAEHRESSRSSKKADARKLLIKRLGEIGRGRLIGPTEEKLTFDEMAEDILKDYEINRRRSISTIKICIDHLRPSFGLDKALDITTDKIRFHISRRQKEWASNATINRELAALKRMFSLAMQAGKLSFRPHVPRLEENNARQGFLDHGNFIILRENLPDHLKDPVTFLYLSGWRVGEMRALEWRDVDLNGKVVRLRPEISKNKDGRSLPLNEELLKIIERARKRRLLEIPFVFHHKGRGIGEFNRSWRAACIKAGLGRWVLRSPGDPRKGKKYEGCVAHDLRRTAVRNLVRAGVSERVAMSYSGHKSRVVFDRYNIVDERDLAQASHKMQEHLREQPQTPAVVVMPIVVKKSV